MTKIGEIATLLPCAGIRALNRPRGHVYMLYSESGAAEPESLLCNCVPYSPGCECNKLIQDQKINP